MSQEDHDSHVMLKPRRLIRGEITYSAAKEKDANILHELGYREQKIRFFTHLYRNRELIKTIVAHHLGLASIDACHVVDVEDWIHGSFNVCIRVDIDDPRTNSEKQVMIWFPLPYRIGESPCPGNADEKVRCEVGTYAWISEKCPEVPIPHLFGFGLSNGKTVWLLLLSVAGGNDSHSTSLPIWMGFLFSHETFNAYAGGFCSYYAIQSHPYMSKTASKTKPR